MAGNTEPVTDLQPVDIKLTSEFRDIIKQEAVLYLATLTAKMQNQDA